MMIRYLGLDNGDFFFLKLVSNIQQILKNNYMKTLGYFKKTLYILLGNFAFVGNEADSGVRMT